MRIVKIEFYNCFTNLVFQISNIEEVYIAGNVSDRDCKQDASIIVEDTFNDNEERLIKVCEQYNLTI